MLVRIRSSFDRGNVSWRWKLIDDGLRSDFTCVHALDGLTRTTSVIYTSDHGEALGQRDHWDKSNLYGRVHSNTPRHHSLAKLTASRRLVFTRSPGFFGISDGATTMHS